MEADRLPELDADSFDLLSGTAILEQRVHDLMAAAGLELEVNPDD